MHTVNTSERHLTANLAHTTVNIGSYAQIVLSSVHWLEAARCSTDLEASIYAEQLDSLNPLWLREINAVGFSETYSEQQSRLNCVQHSEGIGKQWEIHSTSGGPPRYARLHPASCSARLDAPTTCGFAT